jgi:hypothetical protein
MRGELVVGHMTLQETCQAENTFEVIGKKSFGFCSIVSP